MIKHFFFVALISAGLLFVSCKKQYSCQCATTFTKTGYSPYTVSSVAPNKTKTTKKTAEQICRQTEKQLQKNDQDYTSGVSEKVTVSCALKK